MFDTFRLDTRRLRRKLATLAGLAGLSASALALPLPAAADVIFSSIDGSYDVAANLLYDGPSGFVDQALGSSFTVGPQDYTLERISVMLWPNTHAPDASTLTFALRESDAGVPGTVLDTFTVTHGDIVMGAELSRSSALAPVLKAGTTYWLTATPGLGFHGAWVVSELSTGFALSETTPFNGWQVLPDARGLAMRIEGSALPPPAAVPEPSTLLLLGTGIAAGAWRQRRAR